mmetsp:Transcript_3017/g.6360  ORF Transcript_3017/g.6360 Transcript_3017/m.6360 type:complete len:318 (+) Transcript_3017:124-1077(+)|eukprot:CAMPEP_0197550918 /NCGR_PEP_ID=MMETSP1320-20131121/4347_1 /TAXON_ID=91990 /ORGANISM="Bolidomonas sp., Strain RCC2347" /LENGTH=317 /DNA_ID=CAMNT_0043111341 /DNA_START=111 /DNA_END=1064 /DNA_ORIENTATION=+
MSFLFNRKGPKENNARDPDDEWNSRWIPDPNSAPDRTWARIKSSQRFVSSSIIVANPASSPKQPNTVRFVAISDTHGLHSKPVSAVTIENLPEGDVLLHAGDFSNVGSKKDLDNFLDFLSAAERKYSDVIFIAGNHDLSLDTEFYNRHWQRFHRSKLPDDTVPLWFETLRRRCPKTKYLQDSSCTTSVGGLTVYGSPWQPEFGDWAFNLQRGTSCAAKWNRIPDGVDVLMTHGPPLGRGDLCQPNKNRAGCENLLEQIQTRIKPSCHVFGHIHEDAGYSSDATTTYINASTCTLCYRPTNPATVFDLPVASETGVKP